MNFVLSLIIDIVSALIFVLPLYLIIFKKKENKFGKLCTVAFIVYIIAIFSLVGIPSIDYIRLDFSFNIIPFVDILLSPKTSLLNVLLFIPLGIFIPMLWKDKYNNILKVILFGLLLSLSIEILQILTFRLTDVNDLITNTLGTIIGYFIYIKYLKYNKFVVKNNIGERLNPIVIITTIFIIMFSLSPFITDIIWKLIL